MQELEIQEINTDIDLREFVKPNFVIPNKETIQILREQKKRNLENKKEFYPSYCIEYEIAKLLEDKNHTDKVITLIKQMQKDKGILNFTRDYLNQIILTYSDMSIRTLQSRVTEVLNKAIDIKESFREYKQLVTQFDDKIYLVIDRQVCLYSFI